MHVAVCRLEPAIEWIIRLCGWSAILFVFSIFFFIFREAAPVLFGKLNWIEFFTSTQWQPSSDVHPQYGTLALLVGTLSVTALAMAAGRAAGAGRGGLHLRVLHRQAEGSLENPHRTAGGHSVDRLGIHRLHGARAR